MEGTLSIVVQGLIRLAAAYAAIGLVFAAAFSVRGAGRLDPAAKKATLGFRLIILPGSAALWPLLAWRWLRRRGVPVEVTAHRRATSRECDP